MAHYKQPPPGFECPYRCKCPYLGMSAAWASAIVQDADRDEFGRAHELMEAKEEIEELKSEVRALTSRARHLEARLLQQHRMKFKKNSKASVPAAGSAPGGEPRRRGAPAGHPPWTRPAPDHIDRTVKVPPPCVCPHCASEGLTPSGNEHVQLQEDIVLQPRTVVTEYVHQTAWCPGCRREVFATADGELRNCDIGPVAQAAAVYMRHEVKLSYRDVCKVFDGLFGMPFVPASAMAFSHRTAGRAAHLYEDIRNKIQASRVAHGDETHWRIAGMSAFLWYAGNPLVAFFLAAQSRRADVAVSIFGSSFGGALGADSYAGYNGINARWRQACLSHLMRKAREVAERIALMPERLRDAPSLRFCNKLGKFFSICCAIGRRRDSGAISFSAAKAHIPRLRRTRDAICMRPLADAEAENLRQRVTDPKRDGKNLFTFLEVPGMPPTNNHAEQSLRLPVIFRKITFGSQSLHGAQSLAVNLSLASTAKRQGKDPLALFKTILLNGANTPITELYDPKNLPQPNTS